MEATVIDFRQFDLPNLTRPPFWQGTTAAAFREKFGARATVPGGIDDFRPGWTLAYFSVRVNLIRLTDIGWVRGMFAVSPQPAGEATTVYIVTHLPSGKAIATVDSLEHAGQLVETIEHAAYWQDVTVQGAPRAVLDAYFAALKEAGFTETLHEVGTPGAVLLWTRGAVS